MVDMSTNSSGSSTTNSSSIQQQQMALQQALMAAAALSAASQHQSASSMSSTTSQPTIMNLLANEQRSLLAAKQAQLDNNTLFTDIPMNFQVFNPLFIKKKLQIINNILIESVSVYVTTSITVIGG